MKLQMLFLKFYYTGNTVYQITGDCILKYMG